MKAISYIKTQDGNKNIQDLKDKLFKAAPDFEHAITTDAATIAALEADKQKLIEALNRICANPAVQDLIEKDPRTNYLIRDARAVLAEMKGNHA